MSDGIENISVSLHIDDGDLEIQVYEHTDHGGYLIASSRLPLAELARALAALTPAPDTETAP